MRRFGLVMFAVVAGALLVGVLGSAASAQGLTPKPIELPKCDNLDKVDLNGDGKLDYRDFTKWFTTLHDLTGDECYLGGPASGCPAFMDVNGDGIVDHGDLHELEEFQHFCIRAPWQTYEIGG